MLACLGVGSRSGQAVSQQAWFTQAEATHLVRFVLTQWAHVPATPRWAQEAVSVAEEPLVAKYRKQEADAH